MIRRIEKGLRKRGCGSQPPLGERLQGGHYQNTGAGHPKAAGNDHCQNIKDVIDGRHRPPPTMDTITTRGDEQAISATALTMRLQVCQSADLGRSGKRTHTSSATGYCQPAADAVALQVRTKQE